MRGVGARDSGALRTLYDRHSKLVFALCLRVLHDRGEAEDVLVDVFWELWEKWDRYDPSRGSPMTYLVTLARSRAIDRLRSREGTQRREMRLVQQDEADAAAVPDGANPLEQTLEAERRAQVQEALARLEPAQRDAIECAYYDGLSHSEIAEKLNKPLGTVKTWIRQGLIHLRDSLRATTTKAT
jgi:RNA polymerase sigma-70 factor (ECF subfamily)